MPPNPVMTSHRPNRHHPSVLDKTAGEPADQPLLELGMVLEMTLPTVPTLEPAAAPHQRRTAAAHLQVTNPHRAPVPHLGVAQPTLRAPRPLPGRLPLHLQADSGVHQNPPHPDTRQVQTNRHDIRHRGPQSRISTHPTHVPRRADFIVVHVGPEPDDHRPAVESLSDAWAWLVAHGHIGPTPESSTNLRFRPTWRGRTRAENSGRSTGDLW